MHDAVRVECAAAEAEVTAAQVAAIMQRAAAQVLATDLRMRVDTKIIGPGERYSDPRGVRMWGIVMELVAEAESLDAAGP